MSTLYVNSTWTESDCGGYVWGVTAFSSIDDAVEYADTTTNAVYQIVDSDGTDTDSLTLNSNYEFVTNGGNLYIVNYDEIDTNYLCIDSSYADSYSFGEQVETTIAANPAIYYGINAFASFDNESYSYTGNDLNIWFYGGSVQNSSFTSDNGVSLTVMAFGDNDKISGNTFNSGSTMVNLMNASGATGVITNSTVNGALWLSSGSTNFELTSGTLTDDDGFIGVESVISMTSESTLTISDDAKVDSISDWGSSNTLVIEGGTITGSISGVASIEVNCDYELGNVSNVEEISVAEGVTLTLTGDLTSVSNITGAGEIAIDGVTDLSAWAESNGITVDETVTLAGSEPTVDADTTTLYVNTEWDGYELYTEISTGKYYGVNAFSTVQDAIDNVAEDTTTIWGSGAISAGEVFLTTEFLTQGVTFENFTFSDTDIFLDGIYTTSVEVGNLSTTQIRTASSYTIAFDDIYGAGLIEGSPESGDITVDIASTTISLGNKATNVYGGGRINPEDSETPTDGDITLTMNIEETNIEILSSLTSGISAVFGGVMTYSKNYTNYGYWAEANVGVANITINSPTSYLISEVYGGGRSGHGNSSTYATDFADYENYVGEANITVNNGNISYLYAGGMTTGSYTYTAVGTANITVNGGNVSYICAGGYNSYSDMAYNINTVGTTNITIKGGTISNIFISGRNYTSISATSSTTIDNVVVDISGGTITNINTTNTRMNYSVTGDVEINISGGSVTTLIDGYSSTVEGTASLNFVNTVAYTVETDTIKNFDVISFAGATVAFTDAAFSSITTVNITITDDTEWVDGTYTVATGNISTLSPTTYTLTVDDKTYSFTDGTTTTADGDYTLVNTGSVLSVVKGDEVEIDMSILYVDSSFSGEYKDEVGSYKYYGVNAFSSIADAVAAAVGGETIYLTNVTASDLVVGKSVTITGDGSTTNSLSTLYATSNGAGTFDDISVSVDKVDIYRVYGASYIGSANTTTVNGDVTLSIGSGVTMASGAYQSRVVAGGAIFGVSNSSLTTGDIVLNFAGTATGMGYFTGGAFINGGNNTVVNNSVAITIESGASITFEATDITFGIFGAGIVYTYGYSAGSSLTITEGTSIVIEEGAEIIGAYGSIYGGSWTYGNNSSATATSIVTGDSSIYVAGSVSANVCGGGQSGQYGYNTVGDMTITIYGGNVGSSVYGGGMAFGNNNYVAVEDVEINLTNATIGDSVYGGGYIYGKNSGDISTGLETVVNSVVINVNDGTTIAANVYGGGYAVSNNITTDGSESNITEDVEINITGGTISGNVAGGGFASTNTDTTGYVKATVGGDIAINISGGYIYGDVYAGGINGDTTIDDIDVSVAGSSTITISGGQIYGDIVGDQYGDIAGYTTLNVSMLSAVEHSDIYGFDVVNFTNSTYNFYGSISDCSVVNFSEFMYFWNASTYTSTADFSGTEVNFTVDATVFAEDIAAYDDYWFMASYYWNSETSTYSTYSAFTYDEDTTFTIGEVSVSNGEVFTLEGETYIFFAEDWLIWADDITINTNTIYVNSAYASYSDGQEIFDGVYYGYNAFSSIGEGLASAAENESSTIMLESDVSLTTEDLVAGDFWTFFTSSVTIDAESAVTIDITATTGDSNTYEILWLEKLDNDDDVTITISSNISIDTNAKIWLGYHEDSNPTSYVINGSINVASKDGKAETLQIQICENSDVTLNGKITGTSYFQVSGGSLTVNSTATLKLDGAIALEGGRAGSADPDAVGSIIIDGCTNVSATALTINSTNGQRGVGKEATFAIVNGGKVTLTENVVVRDGGVISIELGSSLSYGTTFTNEGTITIDMTNIAEGTNSYTIIDYTGTDASVSSFGTVELTNASDYDYYVVDGDLIVTNVDLSDVNTTTAYVSSDYAGYSFGQTITGTDLVYGVNAFSDFVSGKSYTNVIGGDIVSGEDVQKYETENIEIILTDVSISDSGRVYTAGQYSDKVTAIISEDVSLTISGTTSAANTIIYGAALVTGDSALYVGGDISVTIDSSTGEFNEVYGGGALDSSSSKIEVSGYVNVTISAGTFTSIVGTGTKCLDGTVTVGSIDNHTGTNLTISGGTFEYIVYGGAYSQGGKATIFGDCTTTISGGTFNANVYGGSLSYTSDLSSSSIIEGSVIMAIDSSENAIQFDGDIFVGSYSYGTVTGDIEITFTGKGENLKFASTSSVYGESSSGANTSLIDGDRCLIFDAFTGNFNAGLGYFTNIEITNGSSVVITGAADDAVALSSISSWTFALDADTTSLTLLDNNDTGITNDFDGDDIILKFSAEDLANDIDGMLTVLDAETADALAGFESLSSVTMIIDGVSLSADLKDDAWICGDYSFSIDEDDSSNLVVTKLA